MNPLPPGRTRRAPAPELSAEERAVVERFEAAPALPESSAVVRAMLALAEEWKGYEAAFPGSIRAYAFADASVDLRAALYAALAADPEPLP